MLNLTDTHCHIQSAPDSTGPTAPAEDSLAARWAKAESHTADEIVDAASGAGVNNLICVGCDLADSRQAVEFVTGRDNCWASIGIHPHEAKAYSDSASKLAEFTALVDRPKVVAIGETGLDYFYNHSPKSAQLKVLRFQLELAQKHDLPLIFHVREAFAEFWPVFDEFKGLRGVIHSFTADKKVLEEALKRNLYIGLNGIMTFTKSQVQLDAARAVPLSKLLLETDAPFLTPAPFRGRICEPKDVRVTADFLSRLRGEKLDQLAAATTRNASDLFNLAN